MVIKGAILKDGVVINLAAVATADDAVAQGWIPTYDAKIGDKWENGQFVTPPVVEAVPVSVSMRQARLALHKQGLLPSVELAITSLSEPTKSNVEIEWEYATTIERDWPAFTMLASAVGLTDEQVDQLFIDASKL